jgi:hypothetical protein
VPLSFYLTRATSRARRQFPASVPDSRGRLDSALTMADWSQPETAWAAPLLYVLIDSSREALERKLEGKEGGWHPSEVGHRPSAARRSEALAANVTLLCSQDSVVRASEAENVSIKILQLRNEF